MFRITSPQGKATYVVLGYITAVTAATIGALTGNAVTVFVLYSAVVLALILIGARSFRGDNEDPASTRPAWRMTAKPRAGFVLATLLVAQAISIALSNALSESATPLTSLAVLFWLGVAALYLNSSLRLRRLT